MNISGNTILITGGTSGIGYELAARFLALGNRVIITGRSQSKLGAAQKGLPGVHTMLSDVSDPAEIVALYQKVVAEFPDLNVLVNNAGIMRKINLQTFGSDLRDITRENAINVDGSIRMTVAFLPQLKKQASAAIVNVSSGLAFVPLAMSPVYCAGKAAIHSFTQSLRIQLKNTNVKVFELAPPLTETPLFEGDFAANDLEGSKAMDVKTLVQHAIDGMEKDRLEICPGTSNLLRIMSRIAPGFILAQLNKSVDRALAQPKVS
jgi:uncharacterized oxidoreductase